MRWRGGEAANRTGRETEPAAKPGREEVGISQTAHMSSRVPVEPKIPRPFESLPFRAATCFADTGLPQSQPSPRPHPSPNPPPIPSHPRASITSPQPRKGPKATGNSKTGRRSVLATPPPAPPETSVRAYLPAPAGGCRGAGEAGVGRAVEDFHGDLGGVLLGVHRTGVPVTGRVSLLADGHRTRPGRATSCSYHKRVRDPGVVSFRGEEKGSGGGGAGFAVLQIAGLFVL